MAQELLLTFESDISELSLKPSSEAGTFQIILNDTLIHCRKSAGDFPELKIIKRKIRDIINPLKNLGHSDTK
jgi:selenoprotein W-related protein